MTTPTHAPVYVECLMLGQLDPLARAQAIGHAFITPCHAADADLDAMQRLHFWGALAAYVLGIAEGSIGAEGRAAIVQTLRNVPASQARIGGVH